MSDVTTILSAIEDGEPNAPAKLLPLVYDELRNLAAYKMSQETPDNTLQSTAINLSGLLLSATSKISGKHMRLFLSFSGVQWRLATWSIGNYHSRILSTNKNKSDLLGTPNGPGLVSRTCRQYTKTQRTGCLKLAQETKL